MRQVLSYLAVCLAATTTVVTAEDATILLSGTNQLQSDKQISSGTAKLLVSNRLGWSGSSLTRTVDGDVLEDLNNFGGQQPLFSDDLEQNRHSHRLLVIAQGFDPTQGMQCLSTELRRPRVLTESIYSTDAHLQARQSGRVTVKKPESNFMETSFLNELLSEASPQRPNSRLCSYQRQIDPTTLVDILFRNAV